MPTPRLRARHGGLPALLAPVGVIVAAALVAAASRTHGGFHGGAGPGPTRSVFDDIFTVTLLVMALGVVAWIYLLIVRRDLIEVPDNKARRRSVLMTIALVLAIAAFVSIARRLGYHGIHLPFFQHHRPALPNPAKAHPLPGATAPTHGHLSWLAALGAFALLAAAAIAVWVSSRTTAQPAKVAQGQAEAVSAALDESIENLRAEPDPRRAIIAAYAHMERALAAAGVARRPAEAPLEFLERALVELDATDTSARRLTDLFRFAKFSDHPVDAQAKEDAITALEAVRDELRGLA